MHIQTHIAMRKVVDYSHARSNPLSDIAFDLHCAWYSEEWHSFETEG